MVAVVKAVAEVVAETVMGRNLLMSLTIYEFATTKSMSRLDRI
jgi:hypothetical protein